MQNSASQNAFNGFDLLEKLLNCASKDFAAKILDLFYDINYVSDELRANVLEHILPYSYPNRENKIKTSFDKAIISVHTKAFDVLLRTLNADEVDRYISYNQSIVNATADLAIRRKYLNNILSVDEGNVNALRMSVEVDLLTNTSTSKIKSDFELLLKYTDNADKEVVFAIDKVLSSKCVLNSDNIAFTKEVLRYYNGNIADLKDKLVMFSDKLIKVGCKKDAEYYCNLVLSVDKACANAYWNLCLIKIGARSENDIPRCAVPLKSCSEFNKYLTLVDEARRMHCIQLAQNQKNTAEAKKNEEINKLKDDLQSAKNQKELYQSEFENNEKKAIEIANVYNKDVKWNRIFGVMGLILAGLLIVGIILLVLYLKVETVKMSGFMAVAFGLWVVPAYIIFVSTWIYGCIRIGVVTRSGGLTTVSVFVFPISVFFPLCLWLYRLSKFKKDNEKLFKENEKLQRRIRNEDIKINKLEKELEKVKATKIEY